MATNRVELALETLKMYFQPGQDGYAATQILEEFVERHGQTLDPPPHLTDAAQSEWSRVTQWLAQQNRLKTINPGALEVYVELYGTYLEAREKVATTGIALVLPPKVQGGTPTVQPNSFMLQLNELRRQLIELQVSMGLMEWQMLPAERSWRVERDKPDANGV